MNAENQQERLTGDWIAGFTDGEGCFYIGINQNDKMKLGFQILPEFRLVQNKRDELLLKEIKDYFKFGVVRKNNGNQLEYRVRKINDLLELIKFFNRYRLLSKKVEDFKKFTTIVNLIAKSKGNLNFEDLKLIRKIKSNMNKSGKLPAESSETKR